MSKTEQLKNNFAFEEVVALPVFIGLFLRCPDEAPFGGTAAVGRVGTRVLLV